MSHFARMIVTALYYFSKSCIIAMCGTEKRRILLAPQAQSLFSTSTVGYTRGHVGDKAGPGPQRERITALCAWQPPPLHLIIDEAPEMVSTPLADRPGGADLLTLLHARISTVVVVDTLDRLFPTLAECMAYVEAWGLQGVMLRVLDLEGEVLTLSADNNALFLAALAECRAMSHEGRLTCMGRRARTRAALGA